MKIFFVVTMLACTSGFAAHKKAEHIPECAAIAKSCEAANFTAGGHKDKGRGLWLDCIEPISQGKNVQGVTGHSQDEAKKCMMAMKRTQQQKK